MQPAPLTAPARACYNESDPPCPETTMRVVSCLLVLACGVASAAPAPFAKRSRAGAEAALAERLKSFVYNEHRAYADRIVKGDAPGEWLVVGNTPIIDGRVVTFEQRHYHIKVGEPDRQGNVSFEVVRISMPYRVITR